VIPSYRTGLLIIRAWVEEGSPDRLRAHVLVTGDISTGIGRTLTLVQPRVVGKLVDAWLRDVLSTTGPDTDR
jgi:hypothetical protein